MRMHRWLVAVAGSSMVGLAGCGPRTAGPPTPLVCPNFEITSPPEVTVPPTGVVVQIPGWAGSFVRFPPGAVTDTAYYRITRVEENDTVRIGINIDTVGSSPTQFARSIHIRLNYSYCRPRPQSRDRTMLRNDGTGWQEVPGSGTGPRWEVFADVDHLTAFAIAH